MFRHVPTGNKARNAISQGVSMDARALKAGLTPLFLPVPPMFERAVGYSGKGRFVAFYWGGCDELCFFDDALDTGAINSIAWQIFREHPFVRLHFLSYDFGSAEFPARHWLLLHRESRRFYVGDPATVESFLEEQAFPDGKPDRPATAKTTITLDECIMLAGNIEEVLEMELSPGEMMRRLTEQQAVCSELREWLERLR
jgi:hypothetical protein